MKDVAFAVSPAGIYGMNELAKFLNAMKSGGAIADWQPGRAESGSRGERFIVWFFDDQDAARAQGAWKSTGAA
jgi:hypothetical protein